ncbi:MAG: hypothetical protein ABR990_05035 [Terracidiphilus sp.]
MPARRSHPITIITTTTWITTIITITITLRAACGSKAARSPEPGCSARFHFPEQMR